MGTKPPIELQSIIDAQDNPFVLIDENYNIVCANRVYCETYGITPDDIVGQKCHEVSHHIDTPCHQNGEDCPHKQVFETQMPHQVLHVHYDKNNQPDRVRIKGSPVRGTDGKHYLGEAIFRIGQPDEIDCCELHIPGKAPAFLAVMEQLSRAAETSASILLTGEIGVGKCMAAEHIHKSSARAGSSLMHISCGSADDTLLESELFGHEKDAFNACTGRRLGVFESANGGTLLIDNIDQLPLSLQGKLKHAIETGEYRRMGGQKVLHADVRVVSATSRNLLEMVEDGMFNADLFYRIAGIRISIPPLHERRQDLPALTEAILAQLSRVNNKKGSITKPAMEKLMAHDFPGNLLELRNALQQALTVSTNGIITPELILLYSSGQQLNNNAGSAREGTSIKEVEAKHIADLLTKYGGHRRKVADELGISERTLYRKLDRYDLNDVGKAG